MSADSSITRIGPPRPARDMLFKSYRARRFGLTASVLCLTLIGGCGGGDGADANAAQGSPAQAVAHAPPAPKPTGPLPPDAPCATPECHRRFLDDAHSFDAEDPWE